MLQVGDRIRLYGGYAHRPQWLGDEDGYDGVLTAFRPSHNAPDAIVRLDRPIEASGVCGEKVILSLRYTGAVWANDGIVHIELCDFDPENENWQDRRKGVWVEAAASYERLT